MFNVRLVCQGYSTTGRPGFTAMFNVRLVCQGYSTTEGQGLQVVFNVRLVCQGYSTTEGQGLQPCLMYVLYVRAIVPRKARVYGHV